jgi:peptidylprolyl isomerase
MRLLIPVVLAAAAGCRASGTAALPPQIPAIAAPAQTAFALRHADIVIGSGAAAEPRKCFYAHYTGWLTNGTRFDSSRDTMPNGRPRTPISFAQGARRVIVGWDVGFEGMKVGGQRRLFIPYQLAYGENGRPPVIPPKAELVFDVELVAVSDTLARENPAPGSPPQCPSWAALNAAPR